MSQYAGPGQPLHFHYHGRSSSAACEYEPCPLTREACEKSRNVTHRLIRISLDTNPRHARRP